LIVNNSEIESGGEVYRILLVVNICLLVHYIDYYERFIIYKNIYILFFKNNTKILYLEISKERKEKRIYHVPMFKEEEI